jgi:hypothetical protein
LDTDEVISAGQAGSSKLEYRKVSSNKSEYKKVNSERYGSETAERQLRDG